MQNPQPVEWNEVRENPAKYFSYVFWSVATGNEVVFTKNGKTFRFAEKGEQLMNRQICNSKTVDTWLDELISKNAEQGNDWTRETAKVALITLLSVGYRRKRKPFFRREKAVLVST